MTLSPWLLSAAALTFLIGLAHSVLGERLLIGPLFAYDAWPKLSIPVSFAKSTLRFAWHVTTLAWWGMAVLFAADAGEPRAIEIMGATLVITGAVVVVASRGGHASWPIFLLAGATALIGARGADAIFTAELRTIAASSVAAVLGALALLHVYWAFIGRAGLDAAVPEVEGKPAFVPGRAITFAVALALFAAGALLLAETGTVALPLPGALVHAAVWAIAGVFTLRSVGDFRYCGLFKRPNKSRFARFDTQFYTPLCFLLAAGCAVVAL